MIKIVIADDHAIVRQGLKQIISDTINFDVVAEASDTSELLSLLDQIEVDLLVLDITMPGRSGLEALKQVHQLHTTLPILILSMHPEEQYAVRAVRLGAKGYLTKDRAPEELIMALETIAAGRKYITSTLAEKLAYALDEVQDQPPHVRLSDREYEVMIYLAKGNSVKEIARILNLSPNTINTYRVRILEKLSLSNSVDIVRYAILNKLID